MKNAILINTLSEAHQILRDKSFGCRRNIRWMLLQDLGYDTSEAKRFFEDWPMYMDGEKHKVRKNEVVKLLNSIRDVNYNSATDELSHAFQNNIIDDSAIEHIVRAWHRELFGLSNDQQGELFYLAKPLFDFFNPEQRLKTLSLLNQCLSRIENWVYANKFSSHGLMVEMNKNNLPINTQLNLILDTYTPMLNALSILILQVSKYFKKMGGALDVEPKKFVMQCLQQYPPFKLINRECENKIISIDVRSCNIAEEIDLSKETYADLFRQSLTFGFGDHRCPGSSLVFSFLSFIIEYLLETYKDKPPIAINGAIVIGSTECKAENLRVTV